MAQPESERKLIKPNKDTQRLARGYITPLAKHGLLVGERTSPIYLAFDACRIDIEMQLDVPRAYHIDDASFSEKILTATGAEATSLEGGQQIGRYWGKKLLGEQVSLINELNGTAGTVGIRIPLGNLVEGQPVVLTSGALSGCTMIYAYDSQFFYAYHTGQPGNMNWRTGIDGIGTTAACHRLLTERDPGLLRSHNDSLLDMFASYDGAFITYFGQPGTVMTRRVAKVTAFDYNQAKTASLDPRAGYAYALLARVRDRVKTKALSEDVLISMKDKNISLLASQKIKFVS